MRKKFWICLGSLLGFLSLFSWGMMWGLTMDWKWLPLIIGAMTFLLSAFFLVLFHYLKKRLGLAFLSVAISGFGSGLSASAYYLHIKVFEAVALSYFWNWFLILCGGAVLFFLLYSLSLNLRWIEAHLKWFTFPLLIGGLVALLILWGTAERVVFSLAFFLFLITTFFVFPLIIVAVNLRKLARNLAVASLGAFLLIAIIVLLILSQGDGFSGDLDLSGGSFSVENPSKSRVNSQDTI